jgi:LPS sulfotransferase NodH
LLCDLLASAGIAGRPREYFYRPTADELAVRWGVTKGREYLDRVYAAGTTVNGVFGAKLMWTYLDDSLDDLAILREGPRSPDHELLSGFFPGLRYVLVWREDVARKAFRGRRPS